MEKIDNILIPLIAVTVIALLFIFIVARKKDKKRKPNYQALFIIGISWIPIGISTENFVFTGVGLILMIIGLSKRREWKERKQWSELSQKEKQTKIVLLGLALLVFLVGLGTFLIYK
jgi:membrane-bound ClpP family serine protease